MEKGRHLCGWQWVLACTACIAPVAAPQAQETNADTSSRAELNKQLADQAREIQRLKQAVAEQEARQKELQRAMGVSDSPLPLEPAGPRPIQVGTAPTAAAQPAQQVATLFEQPGILTPRQQLVLEPALQYTYSSSNRVTLVGYTIIPALLIGLVDVREVKRNTLTGSLTSRYGLTNRAEVELKVPYVYRNDSTISREYGLGSSSDRAFNTSGKALGDIELAARYQLNEGGADKPYFVGSLRIKSRTGTDPFEVVTDCLSRCVDMSSGTGLPLELPTGSGFYSLQPSLTWLLPTDPAVFFGGVSYTHNFKRDNVSRRVLNGEMEYIGKIAPGDVIGLNFGMGLAFNERASFSMGVELNSLDRAKQNSEVVRGSVRTQLASLLMGYSYRYSPKTTFNPTVGAGLTRDTPDLSIGIRIPYSF